MKLFSLQYLTREGFRSIWQNRFMALASVGVLISCLLITGGSYILFVNLNRAFSWVYGQNVAVAFAKDDTTAEQSQELLEQIRSTDNVEKVEFISKEETLEKYKDDLPEAVYEDMQGDKNPYPDSFVVTFGNLEKFESTVKQIRQLPQVDDISYNADLAAKLTGIRRVVVLAALWIIALLFLVSLFIIVNTIKLTVYNRRLEISIMKSVGATNAFIRVPFIIEGVVLGIASALLAFGLTALIYTRLATLMQSGFLSGPVSFSSLWGTVLFGFLVIGVLTGAAGSAISLSKYLRNEGGISCVL